MDNMNCECAADSGVFCTACESEFISKTADTELENKLGPLSIFNLAEYNTATEMPINFQEELSKHFWELS